MNRRLIAAISLALAFELGFVAPARAQEVRVTTPMTWVTPEGSPEIRHSLALATMRAEQSIAFRVDPPVKEILSDRGKTAIIITAIIVGAVLIIVGAAVVIKPGKKGP